MTILTVGSASPPASAVAGSYLQWDENGSDFKVFGPNQPVNIYAGLIGFVCDGLGGPVADIYVVADEPSYGDLLYDVSPSPNTVFASSGGLFIDETIGYTVPSGQLSVGWYTVVYDECQDGIFGFEDTAFVDAFYVDLPANLPPIDPRIAQIKAAAAARALTFDQYDELLDNLERLDKALKIANAAQACLLGPLAFQAVCGMELMTDLGSDFFKDQICEGLQASQGGGCAKEMAKDVINDSRKHYQAIAADPPDPNFTVPATLANVPSIPMTDPDAIDAAHLRLADAEATEAALSGALLNAIERYQGADAAGNARWGLAQARGARELAVHLADQMNRVAAAAEALASTIEAQEAELDAAVAQVDSIQDAIAANGLSPEDRRALLNLGLNAAQIQTIVDSITMANLDGVTGAGLASAAMGIADQTTTGKQEVDGLIAELDGHIAALLADATTPLDAPVAEAGGPYAATEGQPITLDGTATTSKYALTSVSWDLDRDGQFDDATGLTPGWTFPAAFDGLAGLRVVDRHGLEDVSYARVVVAEANGAPVISTITPAGPVVEAVAGDSQDFSVVATDPDGDNLTVSWLVDSNPTPAGSGFSFTWTPGPAQVGAHTIGAIVTDGRADGGSQIVTWTVLVRTIDLDGDEWTSTTDCDDADPSVNPGATEILLNGKDDDCDPATSDDGGAPTADFITRAPSGGRSIALYDTGPFDPNPSAASAVPVAESPAFNSSHAMIAALDASTEDIVWATVPATPRFGVVRLRGTATWLIDRVAVMPRIDFPTQRVRAFAVDVSTTGFVNASDWTQVLSAEAADSAALQTFALPGGPVPARYVRIRLLSNRGDANYFSVEQFKVFSPQQSGGTTFEFENRSTDPEGDIVSRLWDFGDGGTSSLDSPSHTFPGPGAYNVTLTVTDSRAHTSSYSLPLRVLSSPTASFSQPAGINEKGILSSPGVVAADPDAERIVRVVWSWGDGSADQAQLSSAPVQHTYQQDGLYTLAMTVVDAQEQATTFQRQVTVANVPPTATLSNRTVAGGIRYNYNASPSDIADPITCSWDFGDGSAPVAGCGTVAHAYPAPAAGAPDVQYTQTFQVTDDHVTVTKTAVVTVTASLPGRSVPGGLSFTYLPPALISSATGPVTCSWNFGDGSAAQAGCGAQIHAYPQGAIGSADVVYPLTVSISDSGGTGFIRQNVRVRPEAAVPYFSTNFDGGAPAQFSGATTTEPVQGYAGYGFAGKMLRNTDPTHSTTLTLTGLPAHTGIDLGFLLAIIDSWDGYNCFAGPDVFNVKIDGVVRLSQIFENSFCGIQSYGPPPDVELARHVDLGFTGPGSYYTDSAYLMDYDPIFKGIPHTGSTLTIEWYSTHVGVATGGDESWGLDNVKVFLNGVASNAPPMARASGPYAVDEGSTVLLDGSASTDPDGGALSYAWDLDLDGAFDDATGATASVTPGDGPASLTVRLQVTDPSGATATDETTVQVSNVAPTAVLSAPASVLEGGTYTVSLGSPADPSAADAAALQYAFDCGLGAGYGAFSTSTSAACTAGDDDNDASVGAKVRDKDGGVNEYTATVAVNNAPPAGTFGATSPILEGASSTLAWTGTSDPSSSDAAALRHSFACDGLISSLTGSWASASPPASTTCHFDDNGTFGVAGRLLDPDNASQTTGASVVVTNVAPSATFNAPASTPEGSGFPLSMTGPSDPSPTDAAAGFTYAFDCGDGQGFGAFSAAASVNCAAPQADGSRGVGGRVRDKDGGVREYVAILQVANVPPTAGAGNDGPRPWGVAVNFTATASDPSPADQAALTFAWDLDADGAFDDGVGQSASRSFSTPGTYTARVQVCDDHACVTASTQAQITAHGTSLAIGGASSGAYSDPAGVTVTLTDITIGTPVPGAAVGVTLGTQSGTATTNSMGIGVPGIVLDQPAGSKTVSAAFVTSMLYLGSTASGSYGVGPEDAVIVYSGDTFSTGTSARLAATVTESPDGSLGNITRASVTFDVYVGAAACGSGTPTRLGPFAVVDTGAPGDGIGSAETTMSTPNEETYCVVARVTGSGQTSANPYYTALPSEYAVLTVVSTSGKSATGGGWIVDPGTGGHGNFGFTTRFTRSGAPKGQSVYVWRTLSGGVLVDVIVKSNSMTGLSFADEQGNGTYPWRAALDGKATLRITRVSDGATLLNDGNAIFRIVAVDSGQSSGIGADFFAMRVLDKDGAEFKLVGSWNGPTYASGVALSGGNVVVHLK